MASGLALSQQESGIYFKLQWALFSPVGIVHCLLTSADHDSGDVEVQDSRLIGALEAWFAPATCTGFHWELDMAAKILIIDDESALRELLSLALTREGFQTLNAENADAAIKHLTAGKMDLVLLDMRLGNGSGLTVLTAIRGNPKWAGLPVIMLTGEADREVVAAAAKLGVQGYVLKSQFSIKELVKRIALHVPLDQRPQPPQKAPLCVPSSISPATALVARDGPSRREPPVTPSGARVIPPATSPVAAASGIPSRTTVACAPGSPFIHRPRA